MSRLLEEIGEVMFARKDLLVDTPYFERKSGQYFYTPDCVGVFWFDSVAELRNNVDGNIFIIQELED